MVNPILKDKKICICLSGKTGSGKSTVADFLVNRFGFKEYSFGQPIRDFIKLALPNHDYHTDPKARAVIIEIAEAPKKLSPECWSFVLTEKIMADNCPKYIVITDLRFKNEYSHINAVLSSELYDYIVLPIQVLSNDDRHIDLNKLSGEEFLQHNQNIDHNSNTEFLDIPYEYRIDNCRDRYYAENTMLEILLKFQKRGIPIPKLKS